MAGVSLDDGGWGAVATNFANALSPDPAKRAHLFLYGAQYNKTLQEIEEQRKKMEAIDAAVNAYPNTLPPNASMPVTNGIPHEGPVSPQMQSEYDAQRRKAIAYQAATARLAKNAEDFAKGVPAIEGQNAISGGIPSDPRRQDVIQTQLSPIGGSLPNYATTPHTYQPTDAAGTAVGAPITSRRMPDGPATLLAPGKAGPANPFADKAAQTQRLFQLAQKAAKDPGSMTLPELEEASVHLQELHGTKNEIKQGPDGSTINIPVRQNPYPETYNPLVAQVAELNKWKRQTGRLPPLPPGAAEPAPGGAAGAAPAPSPDATTGGLTGGPPAAGAPAPAAGAPTAPALVGTVGGIPVGSDVGATTTVSPGDASPLRKEFTDLVPVKSYFRAITPYKQFVENIKVGTPQADVSMIYNLAKMLDPDSVVREGEMLIWKKSGGAFDQLQGLYNRIVESKAALTPKVRANLADMAERVMQPMHTAYTEQADRYREIATQYGVAPEKVVPKNIADLPKIDRKTISSITPAGPGPKGAPERSSVAPAAAAPAPAAAGGARPRTIRVNPATGAIEDVP